MFHSFCMFMIEKSKCTFFSQLPISEHQKTQPCFLNFYCFGNMMKHVFFFTASIFRTQQHKKTIAKCNFSKIQMQTNMSSQFPFSEHKNRKQTIFPFFIFFKKIQNAKNIFPFFIFLKKIKNGKIYFSQNCMTILMHFHPFLLNFTLFSTCNSLKCM